MSCQQVPTAPEFNPYPRSVQVGEFEVAIGGGIWVAIGASGGRYARIQAGSKDLSIRLSEGVPVDSSLRATAAEWHRKAQRFTEMAIAAESASQLV